ncbi:phage portal protein [Nocardia sp. NBC_00565]|uniref:phage portal protein n=1 Tax=Nocardia sp. NBC_00565 TaxID=2975993 RepID=UPI002E80FA7A|nr:phage portal protein [Nocardia sp. NBC_00565]WUC03735.1 phage portal protein [Nocardia sp. NBC_00565]
MASLLERFKGGERSVPIVTTIDDYAAMLNQFQFGGYSYQTGLQQTLAGTDTERPSNNFVGLASGAYAANGVVFACMLVRQLVFSSPRFRWQQLRDGKPSDTFGTADLGLLERPWPGGTTQDLLGRMIQDADLAGNSYWVRQGSELVRLRPDWVEIVGQKRYMNTDRAGRNRGNGQVGWIKKGYLYTEGGRASQSEGVAFTVDEVAHFAPIPDPLAVFSGMSWLTPILREIQADHAMTRHQRKFFDHGATPNLVVKHDVAANEEKVKRFAEMMAEKHGGVENAYRTLHLYPGADVTPVGANLKEIDFKSVRGGGETRIAAAAGVPPIIVGLSEGLASATYSNYGQARRRLADGTAHPLWQNMAGSMEQVVPPPSGSVRLWYDANDVPFLREDEADAATIAETKSRTIEAYIRSGYTPDSVVAAVNANDLRLLVHSGLMSVQLQKPGADPTQGVTDGNGTDVSGA